MPKLKLDALLDEKPVKLTIELPAKLHRDLAAYAKALASETGQPSSDPARLIAPMLARFIASDRAFARLCKEGSAKVTAPAASEAGPLRRLSVSQTSGVPHSDRS